MITALQGISRYALNPEMHYNTPMLEELKLTSRMISMHPRVLDTIPQSLKSLDLDLHTRQQGHDDSPILCYLNTIALQCQLKELVLQFNSHANVARILDAVYRHNHLECLKISFTDEWKSYPMDSFLDGLIKACPRVSHLELKCTNAPSTYAISTLKRLPQLNKVSFSVNGPVIKDSFWDAIQTFSQLKCITIFKSPVAQHERIDHLKKQRPDMEIIH
ncbi:hypothetical protein O0I10_006336 [Lichtheimia ornata]|uniref:Uncharacterized protein n=1 Tax=Lichtheimia ornata TaxID=688661 RepID=A0AAD7V3C1_9FUNG|nr:uncharacterized protein O0I10_006336 [Lichtheimia ornata]KAJ8658064.1 hypothetical protein O0I10_006336 [Lichtheimia ornata]